MFLSKQLQVLLITAIATCSFANSRCPDVPKLRVLPGVGWDPLTNSDTIQLLKFSYDNCTLTSDGKHLIPDNIDVQVFQPENTQVVGEIFGHWSNYTAPTSSGFKRLEAMTAHFAVKEFSPLYYSFSNEYRDVKHLQVKHDAFTTRIQLRHLLYRIYFKTPFILSDSFANRFEEVVKAVSGNRLEEAKRLAVAIISDYGTHCAMSVDVGSIYIKEDYLRSYFLNLYRERQESIISASKIVLQECTGFTWNEKEKLDTSLVEEYKKSLLEKKTRFYGHNEAKSSYLVAIDRTGYVLTNLVHSFPNENSSSVHKARDLLFKAIKEYLTINTRYGCTNPHALNFDYVANMDDGSCKPDVSKYVFGGVFQNCQQQSQTFASDDCSRHGKIINNSITETTKCPIGFVETPLFVHYFSYTANYSHCSCRCEGNGNNFSLNFKDYLKLTTYSCITNSTTVKNGYKFGGLYSADVVNVHTNERSCPPEYTNVNILEGKLSICVSSTNTNSTKMYELPFGGFTSSMQQFLCPEGYTRYLALKYDEGDVYYCLHTRNLTHFDSEPEIKRPQLQ